MKWCPKCHRFGVEYNSWVGHEMCLWKDCRFINRTDIDLDKAFKKYVDENGTSFPKFATYLEEKWKNTKKQKQF